MARLTTGARHRPNPDRGLDEGELSLLETLTTAKATDRSYIEDFSPGSGNRSPARSWLHSDAPSLNLNGQWRFRLWPSHTVTDDTAVAPDFDDSAWDLMPVPSHWVLHGDGSYGRPIYTNVQFPFPIDPPFVPDDNPTADHRRTFELPDWDVERILLRFDGVESVYRVWLNGAEVGVGKGSRLAQEFDVTQAVMPGTNTLLVRVHQWSSMSYLEDQDQWWLPGIFREVTLLGRPQGGIEDVWLRCHFSPDRSGMVVPELSADPDAFPVNISIPELGHSWTLHSADDDMSGFPVGHVDPWSADSPRLYDATVTAQGEKVSMRVGFRTVEIMGDILTVNGQQVIFRGMNRHETHPVRGRMFDEDHARADLVRMKQHNVNAIRTSHYPPHPRVLDLADELGFWVIDECDLETHGFGSLGWRGNPCDDERWEAAFLDRIERTVERDKNHPAVLIWSLGNESGTGRNLAQMSQWVRRRDPARPVHYEGDYTCAYTDIYSRMYPSFVETEAIGQATGPVLNCGPAEARRVRTKPFLMCEYAHAMGNGPGGMTEYDDLTERFPRLHGGFVWEWRDHGLLTHAADGTEFYGYGGDFGELVHDGNFVMDGMVLPDDTPTPGLAEFATVNQPIQFVLHGNTCTVRNRYHSLSTDHLRFLATTELDGAEPMEAELTVPSLAPGTSGAVDLPAELLKPKAGGECWLTVRAELAQDTEWATAGHVVARQQVLRATAEADEAWLQWTSAEPAKSTSVEPAGWRTGGADADVVTLGPAQFDARTGQLQQLHGVDVSGPRLELWRAPTDNDRGASRGSYELASPEETAGMGAPGPSSEQRWRQRGLDRLVHRVRSVTASATELVSAVRVSAANSGLFVEVSYRWVLKSDAPGALRLLVQVVPSPNWDCTWPRIGTRFDLPGTVTEATWFGTGPNESYPDSAAAARVGRFTSTVDELTVRYSRPQETGHRPELRWLRLADRGGAVLRLRTLPDIKGHRPGFTLTRHTPQELDRAAHPYELPESDHVYLFVDNAVHGLGSRACGLDVLPKHALWPGAHSYVVEFESPDGQDTPRPSGDARRT